MCKSFFRCFGCCSDRPRVLLFNGFSWSEGDLKVLINKSLLHSPVLFLFFLLSSIPVYVSLYVCDAAADMRVFCFLGRLKQPCLVAGVVWEVQNSGSWGSFIWLELQAWHMPSTLETAIFKFSLYWPPGNNLANQLYIWNSFNARSRRLKEERTAEKTVSLWSLLKWRLLQIKIAHTQKTVS